MKNIEIWRVAWLRNGRGSANAHKQMDTISSTVGANIVPDVMKIAGDEDTPCYYVNRREWS
jgi:hypothetical protein